MYISLLWENFYICARNFSTHKDPALANLYSTLLKMPRELKHKLEMKTQRLKIKEKGSKYIPGIVTLQVLGSGAPGAPRSLYVFTDQSRYLFNCGEGVQRLAHEHKMKLAKLEHIFITYPSWQNLGGLPGVALTIQDVGVSEINLHGPPGTDEIFSATRRFVILKDLSIKMADCHGDNTFSDSVMSVQYVPLYQDGSSLNIKSDTNITINQPAQTLTGHTSEEEDEVDYYAHEKNHRSKSKTRQNRERSILETRKGTSYSEDVVPLSMCYVCRLKSRPGTLNLEACVEKGVPPGPLLGKLKNGEDVVLQDGTVVNSCDVTTPEDIGPVFIVVDCPSEEYLDSLVREPVFMRHQESGTSDEDTAYTVIHFTPANVMKTEKYQNWMSKFISSCLHLTINEENECMGSLAVHRIQYKLNLLHPEIFPLLSDSQVKPTTGSSTHLPVVKGTTFTSIHLRPRHGYDDGNILKITPETYLKETYETEGFLEELAKLKEEIMAFKLDENGTFPRILFLGTGSCIPNKTRNTSGILVQLGENEYILLDCGESTCGQIIRFFGPEKANHVLVNLKAIYVSHLHADHHIGLIGVLNGRKQAKQHFKCENIAKQVYLLAPKQIMFWLQLYHRRFEPILDEFEIISNTDLQLENNTPKSIFHKFLSDVRMNFVGTVPVNHCPNAFGVSLIHVDGWKITYSGDTMPCQALIELGMNSDILIHEATMEDELEHEARVKMHSTTTQAINIGKQMNAKFILLTHFSQRYARLPRFNDNFTNNVGIAFDNMQISMNQLPLLPKMYAALKLMFAEHYEELEIKAMKRQLREEKKRAASTSPVRVTKIAT